MNEHNYNQEEPDQHWEGFKEAVYCALGVLAVAIILYFYFN